MTQFLDGIGYNGWILPALLALPLVGALLMVLQGSVQKQEPDAAMRSARSLAFGIFLAEAVLSLGLWWSVDTVSPDWQAYVDAAWIPQWGARFTVGIDGIALMLILLTTLLMPLTVLGSWTSIRVKTHAYYALLLVLTTGMLVLAVVWKGRPSRPLWEALLAAGTCGFACAIGIHYPIRYLDPFHLAPAWTGFVMFVTGMILNRSKYR